MTLTQAKEMLEYLVSTGQRFCFLTNGTLVSLEECESIIRKCSTSVDFFISTEQF